MPEIERLSSSITVDNTALQRFRVSKRGNEVFVEREKAGRVSVRWPTRESILEFTWRMLGDSIMPRTPSAQVAKQTDSNEVSVTQMDIQPGDILKAHTGEKLNFIAVDAGEYEVSWELTRFEVNGENQISILFKNRPEPEGDIEVAEGHSDIGHLNKLRQFYGEILELYMMESGLSMISSQDECFENDMINTVGLLLISPWNVIRNLSDEFDQEALKNELRSIFDTSIITKINRGDFEGDYWKDAREQQEESQNEDKNSETNQSKGLEEEALEILRSAEKKGVVRTGRHATRKAIESDEAELVYFSRDSSELSQLVQAASRNQIPYLYVKKEDISEALAKPDNRAVATIIDPGVPRDRFNRISESLLNENSSQSYNVIHK